MDAAVDIDMGDDAVRGNAAGATDTDVAGNAAERTDVTGTVEARSADTAPAGALDTDAAHAVAEHKDTAGAIVADTAHTGATETDAADTVEAESVGGTDMAHSSLVTDIVQICHNNNATHIAQYHLRNQTRIADTVVIATVGSARIMDSLLQDIRICLQSHQHMPSHGVPRHDKSGWVAIDCGSALVHLVAQEQRDYYELDALYQ